MRIGVYQNCPRFGEVDYNVEQALRDLETTEADLIVMPELFNTGYQFISRREVEDLAEEVPSGKTSQALLGLSRDKKMFVVFGLAERHGEKFYNSAAVVGPKGFVGIYRKVHLFSEEKTLFDRADTGFQVFDLGFARIGVMICFDWIFPESARVLALLGADIICHPANLVLPHCQKAMVTRSLENGIFSATANRIGVESRGHKGALTFTGESQILDNAGRTLTRLGPHEAGVAVADIAAQRARNK
ncbi:MAG: acyltransferase, partial [Dehalococcoidia bacterium]|nr:acyltransferase [Dehalococcoidia bacterium]